MGDQKSDTPKITPHSFELTIVPELRVYLVS
jgi:hypothetical protein